MGSATWFVLCLAAARSEPLRDAKLAACDGVSYNPEPARVSPLALALLRANPLPNALRPQVGTVSKQRVTGGADYLWTLVPYGCAAVAGLTALVLLCPCCCVCLCSARGRRQPPFAKAESTGFYVIFAVLALFVLFASLVAVEEVSKVDQGYAQLRCAAYSLLDALLNGVPADDRSPGFLGFRHLTGAVTAASTVFPSVTRSVSELQTSLAAAGVRFESLAADYGQLWGVEHRRQIMPTHFHCSLCEGASLSTLSLTLRSYQNNRSTVLRLLRETRRVIKAARPSLRRMMNGTLTDSTALYTLCFNYGERLRASVARADAWWFRLRRVLTWCLGGCLASVFLGVLSLTFRSAACPFLAWWFSYLHSAGLVALGAVLLLLAVAVKDADGALRAVVADVGAFDSTVFGGLNDRQRGALGSCIAGGDLAKTLNLSVAQSITQLADKLGQHLGYLADAGLDKRALDDFLARYDGFSGATYAADWNASQNLGWRREPGGVAELAGSLHSASMEYWAFQGTQAPDGCALAQEFTASLQVNGWRCFLVGAEHPNATELQQRYKLLTAAQLGQLLQLFQGARSAAGTLPMVLAQADRMDKRTAKLGQAWLALVNDFNQAIQKAQAGVATPMISLTQDIRSLAASTDCSAVQVAFRRGTDVLGRDLFVAQLVLTGAFGVLAFGCAALALLYCSLWSLRQPGKTAPLRFGSADGEGDDGEEMQELLRFDGYEEE